MAKDGEKMEQFTTTIKERIATIRSERNLTMEQLADIAGVSKGTVSRWESGEIRTLRIDKVKRIASACGYNPMWIMGFDTSKSPQSEETIKKKDLVYEKMGFMDDRQIDKVLQFIDMIMN